MVLHGIRSSKKNFVLWLVAGCYCCCAKAAKCLYLMRGNFSSSCAAAWSIVCPDEFGVREEAMESNVAWAVFVRVGKVCTGGAFT